MRKESTDASNPLRALGTVLCEEEEGRSIYVPPFLKYAYVQETPMLVEGNLLKNLLLGNTPNQLPCPRSQSRLRASASASADVCMHVSAWGTFDCVSGRARGVGACRGWCICLSLLSLASRSMRVSQSPVCASAMECGLMCQHVLILCFCVPHARDSCEQEMLKDDGQRPSCVQCKRFSDDDAWEVARRCVMSVTVPCIVSSVCHLCAGLPTAFRAM